ncbi:PREDICTED: sodium- and chloride-dependent glycine transporter 1-like isoform X2 [Priapulus caudatus]|nr:PREDICTED: sodium- and chloride-dependent glycine transporter 1-like isoform X2 [Priapulus caudatus]XP_014672838.1 PREDICTED: sodium- and chloride-dependent glycine transporter 1-like isoform X2 [Priapulus caudatus]
MEKKNSDSSLCVSSDSSESEYTSRGNWSGRMDFILSCIGYAVGLGNVWRFPYLCYRNGGGAFLVPYAIFMILCGMPLFFLELSFGQFASLSPITIWKISPLMKGLGYGMVIISGIVCIYYNIIITWTLYYMYLSVSHAVVPWASCDNEWNTDECAVNTRHPLYNNSLHFLARTDNGSLAAVAKTIKTSPSQEYWTRYVLQMSDGIEDMGSVRLELLACLALAWTLVFLCLFKGVKSSGKVVYFTATFPYVLLTILLIRGCMLPGAADGIRFYLSPNWESLKSFKVWGDAATQIFYSVGPAWGGLITFASYNKFHNNCYRDALIVPLINCGTSVYAGFVVFAILGYMSYDTGMPIATVASQGPGLAFVAYPAAISTLPISPLWAFLFFFMLLLIGLDSQFGMFETLTSAFIDEFPTQLRGKKMLFTAALCIVEFLLGIPCIMNGGMYIVQLMDWYSAAFSLMLICLCECCVISWIYGVDRFIMDIEFMVRRKLCLWWKITWKFITPLLVFILFVFNLVMHEPITFDGYKYPDWAIGLGWVMALASMMPILIIAVWTLYNTPGRNPWERLVRSVRPTQDWGPALEVHRVEYKQILYDNSFSNQKPSPLSAELTGGPTRGDVEKRGLHETTALSNDCSLPV